MQKAREKYKIAEQVIGVELMAHLNREAKSHHLDAYNSTFYMNHSSIFHLRWQDRIEEYKAGEPMLDGVTWTSQLNEWGKTEWVCVMVDDGDKFLFKVYGE